MTAGRDFMGAFDRALERLRCLSPRHGGSWGQPMLAAGSRPERSLGDCYSGGRSTSHCCRSNLANEKISGDKSERLLTEKRYSPY
jgi:hypothetical protein